MSETRDPGAVSARKRYYQEAASWSADVHGALRASRRAAWIIAAAAVIVAALEAFALAALAPLKTVVPYTITVDRQTGYVQMASGLKPGVLSQDQAVTQSFLVQYVIARETFDATDLRDAYRKVMLWSAGDARAQYERLMQRTTPDSPLNLYSPTSLLSVTVKSVSLLSATTALVRFDTTRQEGGLPTGATQSWAAVLAFRYTNAPMTMGDRFLNPLGFQVTRYRRDSETPLTSSVSTTPPPTALPPPPPATSTTTSTTTTVVPSPAQAMQR